MLKAKAMADLADWIIKYYKEREWLAQRTSDEMDITPVRTVSPYITDPRLESTAVKDESSNPNPEPDWFVAR